MNHASANTHTSLISPLAGLNLDAFDPSGMVYPLEYKDYQFPVDTPCSMQNLQYIPFQDPWAASACQPHADTFTFEPVIDWSWPWASAMNQYSDYLYDPRTLFAPQNPFWPKIEFPPSPSDTCTSSASDISPSPAPDPVHVVPLLAPKPLPFHSATFLQFDLPDEDEDLSHPPYLRPTKRKRGDDNETDDSENLRMKRRASEAELSLTGCSRGGFGYHSTRRQSVPGAAFSGSRHRRW